MIRSLRAIVVVILVAIMGVWSASTHAASAAGSGVGMPAYNYDSGPVGSASSRAHDERGPPVTAVDDCLHAVTTAPRFGGLVTRAYTYDHPERHVYTNIATLSGQAPPATVGQLVRKGDFVSGFVVAAKAGGARFVVSGGGEARAFLNSGLEVGEHAGKRMIQKGISLDAMDAAVLNAPFKYFHQGAWKTGYYDRGSNLFVGSVEGKVTTAFRPDRGIDYIRDLQGVRP